MNLPNKEVLRTLATETHGETVSIYMPTHQAGKDTRENPIRFKNLLREAERQLSEIGLREREFGPLLTPARALMDDNVFWQNQRQGLALFLYGGHMQHYLLPYAPDELTAVSQHAHLKPLLPLLTNDGRFFILVMSLNSARLLEATRYSVSEVPLGDMPTSLAEALKYDDFEPHTEHVTVTAPNRGGDTLVQGQGGFEDERKTNILRYFQAFDNGLREMLAPQGDKIPVVFAGDKGIFPIYQEANHYAGLLDQNIDGNPEHVSDEELHAGAWQLVEPHFRALRAQEAELFAQASGTGLASSALEDVVLAAIEGRVATLFLPLGKRQWGTFDSETRTVTLHEDSSAESYDLLDYAGVHTLLNGGAVYATQAGELPGDGMVAALYRF